MYIVFRELLDSATDSIELPDIKSKRSDFFAVAIHSISLAAAYERFMYIEAKFADNENLAGEHSKNYRRLKEAEASLEAARNAKELKVGVDTKLLAHTALYMSSGIVGSMVEAADGSYQTHYATLFTRRLLL